MYNNLKDILNSRKNVIITLLLLGFLAHCFMLTGPFKTMDDEVSIVYNDALRSFGNIPAVFSSSFFGEGAYYRPLVMFSFLLEYKIFGLDPFFYYFTNLLIHLGCSVVVFLILETLIPPKSGLRSQRKNFFIALLFTVHPVHWEALSNIAGRSILLCAFFYLLSFYFYLQFVHRRKVEWYIILSCLSFILSLLSKEAAVTLPAVIVSYEFILRRYSSALNRMLYITIKATPFILLLGIYFIVRQYLNITRIYFWGSTREMALGIGTFLRTVLTHLKMMVWPSGLHFDRAREYFTGFNDPGLQITLGIFTLFILLVIISWRRILVVEKFLLSWVIIAFAPVSQLVPLRAYGPYASSADHFLYLPSVGILALLVIWVDRCLVSTPVKRFVSNNMLTFSAFLILGVFMTVTIRQNLHSRNELDMFSRSLRFGPENIRIRTSYALALAKHRRFAEAEQDFRRVLAKEPFNTRARVGLGKSLCDQDRYWEGIQEYEKIQNPGKLKNLLNENIKLSYAILIKKYHERIEQEQDNPELYYSLGVMYSKTGRPEDAVNEYRKAVALRPDYKDALNNLAVTLDMLGEKEEAREYINRIEKNN